MGKKASGAFRSFQEIVRECYSSFQPSSRFLTRSRSLKEVNLATISLGFCSALFFLSLFVLVNFFISASYDLFVMVIPLFGAGVRVGLTTFPVSRSRYDRLSSTEVTEKLPGRILLVLFCFMPSLYFHYQ